jgi:hypothetical protein
MSDEEARLLNVFLSNFGETFLPPVYGCPGANDDDYRIAFGVLHNFINKHAYGDRASGIPADQVAEAVWRYFGVRLKNHRSVRMSKVIPYDFTYSGGYYHFEPGDGDPWAWSNATNMLADGAGGFRVAVQDYYSHCDLPDPKSLYNRRKLWNLGDCAPGRGGDTVGFATSRRWSASIAPHVYNGRNTYKMVTLCP